MSYNILEENNVISLKKSYKKHILLMISFIILSICTFLLCILFSNRNNLYFIVIIGTMLITLSLICATFLYFSFIKIEKDYLVFLNKIQIMNIKEDKIKITNDYLNETSYFNKVPCYLIKTILNEKTYVLYLEKTSAPTLDKDKTYIIKSFRHFIIEIKDDDYET